MNLVAYTTIVSQHMLMQMLDHDYDGATQCAVTPPSAKQQGVVFFKLGDFSQCDTIIICIEGVSLSVSV